MVSPSNAPLSRALSSLQVALDPVRETQATFRVALSALSRPGRVHSLPVAARGAPSNPWAVALLITLLDHETSLAVAPMPSAAAIERFVQERTLVAVTSVDTAAFVLADTADLDPTLPLLVRQGELAFPDGAATLIIGVPSLDQSREDSIVIELTGPGIPGSCELRVPGLPGAFFDARARAISRYPLGPDLLLVDAEGCLVALPRSTNAVVVKEAP